MDGPRTDGVLLQSGRSFPRDVAALPAVFALVNDFLSSRRLEQSVRFSIDFALEEIFTNVVKYNPAGAGEIGVDLILEGDLLKVAVTDSDAPPFDPRTDAPESDVSAPLDQRTPGGLGVQLLKKMMDRIDYVHHQRTGTVTLYKRLE